MPLSVELTIIPSIGTCRCGLHGALMSVQLDSNGAQDTTEPCCSACFTLDSKQLVLMTPESSIPRAPSKRVKKLSQKQERKVMAELPGGRTQPGSGSRAGYKGDGRVYDRIRVEMKQTATQSMGIVTRDVLNKIRSECAGREEPIVVVDFTDKTTGRVEDRWCVIEHKVLKRVLDATELNS